MHATQMCIPKYKEHSGGGEQIEKCAFIIQQMHFREAKNIGTSLSSISFPVLFGKKTRLGEDTLWPLGQPELILLFLLALTMALVRAEASSSSLKHTTNAPVFSHLISWKKQQAVKECSPHHYQCGLMDVERESCLRDEAYEGQYTLITTS